MGQRPEPQLTLTSTQRQAGAVGASRGWRRGRVMSTSFFPGAVLAALDAADPFRIDAWGAPVAAGVR